MRRNWLPVWLCLMLALLCAAIVARTQYRTDMGDFLPRAHNLAQQALNAQVSSGGASRILMLSIDDAPPSALAQLSHGLGAKLRANPAFIAVLNGDDAAMAGVQAFVWGHRYLLSADISPPHFTASGLREALRNDLSLLSSDLGAVVSVSLPADPTGEAMGLAQQLGGGAVRHGPQSRDGVWFAPDGRSALILIRTASPGFDIDAQAKVLGLIRQAFAALRADVPGAQQARLQASGPGVFAVDTRDVTKRDVTRLSILATAGAVLFLLIAYRSPRVLLLGLLPVACGALAATAAVSLAFGFVHAITLGFGVTLIGEAMDYSIYLLTQTLKGDRADRTLARIWPTLRLGVLTSIAGFCTMLLSDFTGFAQLGLFSVAGLAGAAAVTRFVLPRLVPDGFFASGAAGIGAPLRLLLRGQRWVRGALALLLVVAFLALAGHRGALWDDNLLNLSPLSPATQALDQRLRHDLGVPDTRYFIAYEAPGMEQALETSEALQSVLAPLVANKTIGGYDLPSFVLPSARTQRARLAALPDDATLHAAFTQALSGLPFRPESFAPFFVDVARARAGGLLTEAALPALLALRVQSMLMPAAQGWTVLAPLQNVADTAGLRAALKGALPAGAVLVDLDQQSADLLHTFQHESVMLAAVGSLAILLLLFLSLRSPRRVLAVAAPVAAAVVLTAAILTMGGKLSIFMVAGFLLIVALGSNYCLFFARPDQPVEERARALASIMLANLCTVAAYGLLSLSRIPVLHDIGLTVAIGTFLCLVCGAAFSAPAADRARR
jgi:predicted exporter